MLRWPLWKQGQWYLLTCQPLIDWHSSPSSENWIYWTVEMECPRQTLLKRQGVTLSSSYIAHKKYDMKSQKLCVDHVEMTPWVNAHERAIGDNRITGVFSNICLLESWLQTAHQIYIFFKTLHPYQAGSNFQGQIHISPLPGPCLCAHCSTWLAMCDDTYTHLTSFGYG